MINVDTKGTRDGDLLVWDQKKGSLGSWNIEQVLKTFNQYGVMFIDSNREKPVYGTYPRRMLLLL